MLSQDAGGRTGLAYQQAVAGQGRRRQTLLCSQRVAAVRGQHQRVLAQHQAGEARILLQLRGSSEVDTVLLQSLDHLLRVADLQGHLHLRQALAEALHQVEHVVGRGGGDAQAALQLAAIAQEELDVGFLLQQLLHHRQQARALLAQGQATAATVEQLDTVLRFQVADLRGDRGLAEAKLLRRLGDAAQAGDHVKRF
ncbi:hypothetical protein D9M70_187170 [compost metagenome]